MRLILLFSALLAALTGVGASARAAQPAQVEQSAATAAEATVAVAALIGTAFRHTTLTAAPASAGPRPLLPAPELYRDRLRE